MVSVAFVNSISAVRMAKQELDRTVAKISPEIQGMLCLDGLASENIASLKKVLYMLAAAQCKVANITELFGDDSVSALRFACYDANAYLKTLINSIIRELGCADDTILIDCAACCDSIILDVRRTSIIISNLISNAIIHSKTRNTQIKLTAFLRGDDFVIEVSDNGHGISKSKIKTLFSAYEEIKNPKMLPKFDAGLTESGLGLSVCRKAAREMDGDVNYIPSPKGARFELYIPQLKRIDMFFEDAVYIPNKDDYQKYIASAVLHLLDSDPIQ